MRKRYRKLTVLFRRADISGTPVLYVVPAVTIGLWRGGKYFSWVLHLRFSWLLWEVVLIWEKFTSDE